MIKNFKDIDGKKFNLQLRGSFSYIKTAKKLKEILDRSISSKESRLAESYRKHGYMYTMRDFGMITRSEYLGQDK